MFDVKVKSVKVINMQGKLTRIGRTFGKRKDWKKAYVRLEEGFDINYFLINTSSIIPYFLASSDVIQ